MCTGIAVRGVCLGSAQSRRRVDQKEVTPMPATVSVPETMAESLRTFVKQEKLPLQVVTGPGGAVQVVESAEGEKSTLTVLKAGGWIACPMAREMAPRLGIQTREVGKLLDHLDIRIRACELGCFE